MFNAIILLLMPTARYLNLLYKEVREAVNCSIKENSLVKNSRFIQLFRQGTNVKFPVSFKNIKNLPNQLIYLFIKNGKMKTKILLPFFTLLFMSGRSQDKSALLYDVMQVSEVKWDSTLGIPYKMVPGANLGATSFSVVDHTRIAYLSNATSEIIITNRATGKAVRKFQVVFAPRDFVYDKGHFYVLSENLVTVYDSTGKETRNIPIPDSYLGIERLTRYGDATYLVLPSGNSLVIESAGEPIQSKEFEGVITDAGYFVKTQFTGINSYSLKVTMTDKSYEKIFFTDKKIAGVFVVGTTRKRIVLDVQTFISENPIFVERSILSIELKTDEIGNIVSKTNVPDIYYVLSNRDVYATGAGEIYNMVSAPSGLFVFSLSEIKSGITRDYPITLRRTKYYFTNHLLKIDN